jgi:hypothetical protein
MERFPRAVGGPQYEMIRLARTMDDLASAKPTVPRPGDIVGPLAFVTVAVIALLAFVGWLLFG